MINISYTLGTNTGKSSGDVRMGRPIALLPTRGKQFAAADMVDSDTFKEALEAAFLEARESDDKVFVLAGFREVEDATGDPNFGTLADGYEELLTEAIAKYKARHTAGAGQTQSYTAFNGWADGFFVIDHNRVLWYLNTDTGGAKPFSSGTFYASYPKFGNTGNVNTGQVRFSFGNADEFKGGQIGALQLDFDVLSLQNIEDVELKEVAAASGYAFTIGAVKKFTGTNIYPSYDDLLAVVGAWKANLLDGTVVDIATVVKSDTLKAWVVTLDNTPVIANGTKIKISLNNPAALSALTAPAEGIESDYVKVTKAA